MAAAELTAVWQRRSRRRCGWRRHRQCRPLLLILPLLLVTLLLILQMLLLLLWL